MASMIDTLQGMNVFQDRTVDDSNSALLRAGLAMMQPTATGSVLEGLTGGVNAGLADLEKSQAALDAQAQLAFQNNLATQKTNDGTRDSHTRQGAAESQSTIGKQNADTNTFTAQSQDTIGTANAKTSAKNATTSAKNAETQAGELEQRKVEWDEGWEQRMADVTLTLAEAGYKDRLPVEGSDGGSGSLSAAALDKEQWLNAAEALIIAEPHKFARDENGKLTSEAQTLALYEARKKMLQQEGVASNQNAPFTIRTAEDGQAFGNSTMSAMDTESNIPAHGSIAVDQQTTAAAMGWNKEQWDEATGAKANPTVRANLFRLVQNDPKLQAAYLANNQ